MKKSEIDYKFRAYVKTLPCLVSDKDCCWFVEFHHVRTVGAGGVDEWNGIPLCSCHHRIAGNKIAIHTMGKLSWQKKYNLDLNVEAVRVYSDWLQR